MKKKERFEQICQIAARLFKAKGYEAVTIDEICKASGITKPTFYAASLSKAKLLFYAYKPEQLPPIDSYPPDTNWLGVMYEAISQVIDQAFRYGPDLLRDFLRMEIETPSMRHVMTDGWLRQMEELIARAMASGQIQTDVEPALMTCMIETYIIGYCFQYSISCAQESKDNMLQGIRILLGIPQGEAV